MDRGRSEKFLLHSQELRYHIGYLLAITTGMRLGEVLGLRWQDVDFEKHTVTISQTSGHDNKIKNTAKTNSSKRTIPVPKETMESLKKHKITINKVKLRFGSAYQDFDLINCNEFGMVLRRGNVRKNFIKTTYNAGIKKD